MRGAGQQAFAGELARFAADAADGRLAAIAERAAAPPRVIVHGRRGVGRSVVARALDIAATTEPEVPEVVVYVIAEVVKPEDVEAVQAERRPVLAVLNKADVTGFAGDGPMALARQRCEHFSGLLGVPVEPMSGLLAVAEQLEDTDSGALGPFGGAVAVAAVRRGKTTAQVRALLRRVSGVDAVLDRLDAVGAEVRYRRVLDAVAELEALAVSNASNADVGAFLARDATVLARMAAAIDAAESAGLEVEPCHDRAGYLSRAARWQRYGRAGADIARGSLRLWSGAAG